MQVAENSINTAVSERDRLFHHQLRAELKRRQAPKDAFEVVGERPTALQDKDGNSFDYDPEVRGVQLLDKFISTVRFQEIEADIWSEDDRDICLHIVPKGEHTFIDFEHVRTSINAVFRNVFQPLEKTHGVHCVARYWGHRTGDGHVKRITDRSWPGGDLFDIRVVNLMNRPLAESYIVDVLRHFDRVVARQEPVPT